MLTDVQKEALQTKTKNIPYSLGINTWRQVHVTVSGEKISCMIDGKEVGSLRSPGIAHETKTWVRLLVPGSVGIDDVKFWRKNKKAE